MAENHKRSWRQRMKDRYRLIIYNDDTLKEVGFMRLTGFNFLWVLGLVTVVMSGLVYVLIAYTSIREFIPDYPDSNLRRMIIHNSQLVDSLEMEIQKRDRFFQNMSNIISGRDPLDVGVGSPDDSIHEVKNINLSKSERDSLMRVELEQEEQLNLAVSSNASKQEENSNTLFFYKPVNGVITNLFDAAQKHYGIDIVSKPNELVKSVLDGTVVMATWTIETGHVVYVQHSQDFISVYKHNSEILKREGTKVRAGEPVAVIGNSGEYSTGPHLHFELWKNGVPVDPQQYIIF